MSAKNLSKQLLTRLKVVEFLAEDYEIGNPALSRYLEAVTVRFILDNLTPKDRLILYSILEINDTDRAVLFVRQRIPYLKKRLYLELKQKLERTIK